MGIDLFVWHGPLWGIMHGKEEEKATASSPVAINVYGEKTSAAQLLRRTAELQTLSGNENASAMAEADLIQQSLLRMRARYNDSRIPDFTQEAQAETARLIQRGNLQSLQEQGYTQESFALKLAAAYKQQYYLEQTLTPQTETSEAEVASLAGQIADYLVLPERRDARHIFLATHGKDEATVQAQAESLLAQLQTAPQNFESLAATHSEDARTAKHGGNLGTIYVYPQPALPELKLFGQDAIPADTPTLARSKWGWHIVLAGPIQEPRPLTEAEYKESVLSAIISYKTGRAVDAWMQANTAEAEKKNRIQTYGK